MNINLLRGAEPNNLEIATYAGRTCWQSYANSDDGKEKDKEFLNKICNVNKHGSIAEHLIYTFDIQGVSRALLQEFARHRKTLLDYLSDNPDFDYYEMNDDSADLIKALSVKSTRYTLKELKDELSFERSIYEYMSEEDGSKWDFERASNYIMSIPSHEIGEYVEINEILVQQLENLRKAVSLGLPNDITKYAIPDCYKTQIVCTINGRSLQNFLKLRSGKAALWEMRLLARNMFNVLPEDHKYLYENYMDKTPIKYVDRI